jgi:hypothetical protein
MASMWKRRASAKKKEENARKHETNEALKFHQSKPKAAQKPTSTRFNNTANDCE